MCIAVLDTGAQRDHDEKVFQRTRYPPRCDIQLDQLRAALVAAIILLASAPPRKHAHVLKAQVGVIADVKALNHQKPPLLTKLELRYLQAAMQRRAHAEILVGRQLRKI
ncbi:hypothetical protein D3C76_992370 [compost metagenome]